MEGQQSPQTPLARYGGRRVQGLGTRISDGVPLVSIVTVVRNSAELLRPTIRSVLSQTYPRIEYIVVDGNSSDDTLAVIHSFAGDIDYFVSENDGGIFDAMNKGIALCTGELICTLNSGDWYAPHAIELMVAKSQENPGSIIYTDYFYGRQPREAPDALSPAFNIFNMGVAHQSLMIPADLYTSSIGQFRTDFRVVADHIWMREAYRKGVPFCRIAERLLHFDSTGLSSGKTQADRELFEMEASRRVNLLFPFVPAEIGRDLFQLRFSDAPSQKISEWLASMKNEFAESDELWLTFRLSLDAYVHLVQQRRQMAGSDPEARQPGAL